LHFHLYQHDLSYFVLESDEKLSFEEEKVKQDLYNQAENYTQWTIDLLQVIHPKQLVLLFAQNCFRNIGPIISHFPEESLKFPPTDCLLWTSPDHGPQLIHDWAKQNRIKCLTLEPFLQGREEAI
jgi:hypothetical protein